MRLFGLALTLGLPLTADAATAELLRDINDLTPQASSHAEQFTELNGNVLFRAGHPESGEELWITDGTSAGTRLLKDIVPGANSGFPLGLLRVGSLVYFRGGAGDLFVWRSDGTEAGTFSLGAQDPWIFRPEDMPCITPWAASMGGRTWFFRHPSGPEELWSTDGTVAGTRVEFAMPALSASGVLCGLHATAHALVFMVNRPFQEELWRTDGTLAGTYRLGTLRPAGYQSGMPRGNIVVSGGFAYLLADGGAGYEVWRTDGTLAGTTQVADLVPGTDGALGFRGVRLGDGIVFSLYTQTGTAGGLYRVASATPAPMLIKSGATGVADLPLVVGAQVYFDYRESGTTALWVTDGTATGTRELFNHGAGASMSINGYLAGEGALFYHGPIAGLGHQWWVTNGLPGAQRRIGGFTSTYQSIRNDGALLQGRPVFAHLESTSGFEPWIVRNAAPVATADTATVAAGSTVLVTVRSNDTDADSAAADLVVSAVTSPAHGIAQIEGGAIRYTPAAGYSGADSFEYRLIDEMGTSSAAATVSLTVAAGSGSGSSGGGSGTGSSGSGGGGGGGGAIGGWLLAALLALCHRRRVTVMRRF